MTTQPSITAPSSQSANEFQQSPQLRGLAPLDRLGVIRVRGEDAATFIHGQISNDVLLLKPGNARLAAYCSAKGRALASFIIYKMVEPAETGLPPDLLLICTRDALPATLKRLSMFVLRAKAKLTDASSEFNLHGWVGQTDLPPELAALPPDPWAAVTLPNGGAAIRLYPGAGQFRALIISPAGSSPLSSSSDSITQADWQWLDTLAGVPLVSAPLADQLVPQMLNYESTGGINFKKGCYPGQEIVARSQFRGTLKRRLYIVQSPIELKAGQDVLNGTQPDQVTGLVVQAAPVPGAQPPQWVANVSVQIAATESAEGLYAKAAEGATPQPLSLLTRPYLLLENI